MRQIIVIFICLGLSLSVHAQDGRSYTSVNSNWFFHKGELSPQADWQRVNLPHSWNTDDPFDDEPGYYRGVSWYKKTLNIERLDAQKKWFLHFEGVNQMAEVYINDQLAGKHTGGYTAFNVPISDYLKQGDNELKVRVDNSHSDDIIPLKGDFNFYGGIYRDVWLINTSNTHFEFSQYGDQGVFVSTPSVSKEKAEVTVRSNVVTLEKSELTMQYQLFAPDGEKVLEGSFEVACDIGKNAITHTLPSVKSPRLWHPDSPQLYRLEIVLSSESGQILDNQQVPVGLRWFRFDPDEGFFINGKHLKLAGTNRHQDYEGQANALSDDRHVEDVRLIKNMGSNFFRTAHYPQDPAVLRACDQQGLLVSMEIPLDHDITDSKQFYNNAKFMMQEMIRQYYNHPSVIIWAYMNEMLLGRSLERDSEKIAQIVSFAKELEKLTRQEDSTRYTMIPNHGALDLYHKAGLTEIPMLVGWNLYFGWYEKTLGGGQFLDEFHELIPDKPVLVTEYGAGADPRIRSFDPLRFDFSVEWQTKFHQQNLIDFMERPYVSATAIWNLADFGSENRNDAVPKINSKGVMSITRHPKDAYYLYQSWLKKESMVKIGGCDWSQRITYDSIHPMEVFTNAEHVKLLVNGKSAKQQAFDHNLSRWEVPLHAGINVLKVQADFKNEVLTDHCQIEYQPVNKEWASNNTLHINCGSNFYFIDPAEGVTWLPDRQYTADFGGYIGGSAYSPRDRGLGSDHDILNTDKDPVYQTGRIDGDYRFDLEKGQYEITLHWAETDQNYQKSNATRAFIVTANGKEIDKDIDLATISFSTALARKYIIDVDDKGLELSFNAVECVAIINAIEIRKL